MRVLPLGRVREVVLDRMLVLFFLQNYVGTVSLDNPLYRQTTGQTFEILKGSDRKRQGCKRSESKLKQLGSLLDPSLLLALARTVC